MGILSDALAAQQAQQDKAQEEAKSLFPPPSAEPFTSPYSPEQRKMTATLATLAEKNNAPEAAETFNSHLARNEQKMNEPGGEEQIRSGINNKQKIKRREALRGLQREALELDPTPTEPGVTSAEAQQAKVETAKTFFNAEVLNEISSNPHAIEDAAVLAIQNAIGDDNPWESHLMQQFDQPGAVLDNVAEHVVRLSVMNKWFDAELQLVADEPSWKAVLNAFVFPGTWQIMTQSFTGKGLKEQSDDLWAVPLDQLDAVLAQKSRDLRDLSGIFVENPEMVLRAKDLLMGMNNQDLIKFTAWGLVDAAFLASMLIPIGQAAAGVRSAGNMAGSLGRRTLRIGASKAALEEGEAIAAAARARAGRRTDRFETIRRTAEDVEPIMDPEDAIAEAIPTFGKPNGGNYRPSHDVGISTELQAAIKADREAVDTILARQQSLTPPERFSSRGQMVEAIEQETARLKRRFVPHTILDVREGVDPASNIRMLTVQLGRDVEGGGGFLTRENAEEAALDYGFNLGDVVIEQYRDNQWVINFSQAVRENGVMTPAIPVEDYPSIGFISRFFGNPDNYVNDIFNEARHLSQTNRGFLEKRVIKPLFKIVSKLGSAKKKQMSTILAIGESRQKYFTQNELVILYEENFGRIPTRREFQAYYATVELNRMHLSVIRNDAYTTLARNGFETIGITNEALDIAIPPMNARVVDNPQFGPNGVRALDADTNVQFAAGTNAEAFEAKMATGDYEVIELHGNFEVTTAGEPTSELVKFVVVNKNSRTRGPLERKQINEIEGGHRQYPTKWFIKQTAMGEFKDGISYLKNPNVIATGKTKIALQRQVENLEAARVAYNELKNPIGAEPGITVAEAEAIIERSPIGSIRRFDELVDSGFINAEHKFEVLFNRTNPAAYEGVHPSNKFWDDDVDGVVQFNQATGRMYYSPKGERLQNSNFDQYAEIIEPFKTLQNATQQAVTTRAGADYQIKVIEEWVRGAKPHMGNLKGMGNAGPMEIFLDGRLSNEFVANNGKLAETIENNRRVIKRFMATQTPMQKQLELVQRNIGAWLEGKGGAPGEYVAGKLYDKMDKNPLSAAKGFVFDLWLGGFDPGQYFLQTQTTLATIGMAPVRAPRAIAGAYWIRAATINQSPQFLDFMSTKVGPVVGMEPAEWKAMVQEWRISGLPDPSGDMVMLDRFTNNVGASMIIERLRQTRQLGRFFFLEAEELNRMVAYTLAWQDVRQTFPNLPVAEADFRGKIRLRASDYFQSMSGASAAAFQKGIASIPAQFRSYSVKITENVFANPRNSTRQKVGLALSQLLLYGTGGWGVDWLFEAFAQSHEEETGEPLSPEAWRLATRGILDSLMFELAGADTDMSKRASVVTGLGEFWRSLAGDAYGSSFLSVVGGPAGNSFTGPILDTIKEQLRFYKGQTELPLSSRVLDTTVEFAKLFKSVDRLNRAAFIWNMGYVADPNTGRRLFPANKVEALAVALGIPLAQRTAMSEMQGLLIDNATMIDQIGDAVAKTEADFYNAMAKYGNTGDDKYLDVMRDAALSSSTILSVFQEPSQHLTRDAIRSNAVSKATHSMDKIDEISGRYAIQLQTQQKRFGTSNVNPPLFGVTPPEKEE